MGQFSVTPGFNLGFSEQVFLLTVSTVIIYLTDRAQETTGFSRVGVSISA
jgi:hypothetical protein